MTLMNVRTARAANTAHYSVEATKSTKLKEWEGSSEKCATESRLLFVVGLARVG